MASTLCPHCEVLWEITTTGIALEYTVDENFNRVPVGSARRWQLVMHVDKRVEPDTDGKRPLCMGSGAIV